MIITAIYDKKARYLNRLSLYENRIVAYRDYYLTIQNQIKTNPFMKQSDFALLEFGYINNSANLPVLDALKEPYEVTEHEVEQFLKANPVSFLNDKSSYIDKKNNEN